MPPSDPVKGVPLIRVVALQIKTARALLPRFVQILEQADQFIAIAKKAVRVLLMDYAQFLNGGIDDFVTSQDWGRLHSFRCLLQCELVSFLKIAFFDCHLDSAICVFCRQLSDLRADSVIRLLCFIVLFSSEDQAIQRL